MQVSLEAIKFNHDPTFEKTGAFNLRRNETSTVTAPEWRSDSCSNFECSPVGYVTKEVPSPVTILASFLCYDASVTSVKVHALSQGPANVLGDIPEHDVAFNNGQSGFVPLELTNAKLSEAAIGVHDITWDWQICRRPKTWTDLKTTKHRIYTVPALPSKPWEPRPERPDPSNIHFPWTEVLDHACSWAAGVKDDHDEVAKCVTENFYELGKTLLAYSEGASYAFGKFDCTKFLKLLKTGIGGSQTVNCDDCATVVSTFANILGCELHQSGMGRSFPTNLIRLIGAAESDWKPTTFLYHAVAWKGDCLANDPLFDGCLQVDNDGVPSSHPQVAFQPVNVKFGEFRDEKYKFCLVKQDAHCQPIPNSKKYGRKRRQLGQGFLADVQISEEGLIDIIKGIYKFETWPPVEPAENGARKRVLPASLFKPEIIIFPNWHLHEFEHLEDQRFKNVFLMLFKRSAPDVQELLAVNLYECREVTDPNNFLLEVLGSFEQLTLTRMEDIGSVAFQEPDEAAVLFRRDRFIGVVRSAGRQSISVIRYASILDVILTI